MIEQPEVIFLDAVGTLFRVQDSVGAVYGTLARQQGIQVDDQALNRAFYQAFSAAPPMAFPGVNLAEVTTLEYQWWEAIAIETFRSVGALQAFPDFPAFFAQLYDYFKTDRPWFIYPDVEETLKKWQNQGIKLGVLSNFDSRLFPVLEVLNLSSFFSSVTISTTVGAAKPSIKIFQAALQNYNASAERVLHIGDSVSADYQGAKDAGIQVILIDREEHESVRSRLERPELEYCISLQNIEWQ